MKHQANLFMEASSLPFCFHKLHGNQQSRDNTTTHSYKWKEVFYASYKVVLTIRPQTMSPKKKKSVIIGTPDLVPWLPPGKTKDETFNSFAHKKNSGQYDLSASMQQQPGQVWSTSNSKKFSSESFPWSIRWAKQ